MAGASYSVHNVNISSGCTLLSTGIDPGSAFLGVDICSASAFWAKGLTLPIIFSLSNPPYWRSAEHWWPPVTIQVILPFLVTRSTDLLRDVAHNSGTCFYKLKLRAYCHLHSKILLLQILLQMWYPWIADSVVNNTSWSCISNTLMLNKMRELKH